MFESKLVEGVSVTHVCSCHRVNKCVCVSVCIWDMPYIVLTSQTVIKYVCLVDAMPEQRH